jgi:hypothetical protein
MHKLASVLKQGSVLGLKILWIRKRGRYDKKAAQLRQTGPQVDWSNVNSRESSRRVILYLDQQSAD